MSKRWYGKGLPGFDIAQLKGLLVVIEGPDGSGRSTQSAMLRDWLERQGYPTSEIGLKRSTLVGRELEEALRGNTLHPLTFALFYATDFADQLEHSLIPALRAGFVVIADRYIYTLMARNAVRGVDRAWIRDVYGMALVPDALFYLDVSPQMLAERSLRKQGGLNYWESGMDIYRAGDLYQSFIHYQKRIRREFDWIIKEYKFAVIDGDRDPSAVQEELQSKMRLVLRSLKPSGRRKIVFKSVSRRKTAL